MELIFRKGSNATPLRLPSHGALSVGRSQNTDYQVDGLRVSAVHVKITEGPDPTTLTVTDVSHNGTGLVARGTTPAEATMLHRASTTVKMGTGILLPVEQPGGATQRTVDDTTSCGSRRGNSLTANAASLPHLHLCHFKQPGRRQLRGRASGQPGPRA